MSVKVYAVWQRYRRKIAPGEWNIDSGKTHAVVGGRTLCGRIPGTIEQGWELDPYRPPVECERCRTSLSKIYG